MPAWDGDPSTRTASGSFQTNQIAPNLWQSFSRGLEGIIAAETRLIGRLGGGDVGQASSTAATTSMSSAGKGQLRGGSRPTCSGTIAFPTARELDGLDDPHSAPKRETAAGSNRLDYHGADLRRADRHHAQPRVSMLGLLTRPIPATISGHAGEPRHRIKLVAQIGIIAAYFHRTRTGKDLPPIRKDLSESGALPLAHDRQGARRRGHGRPPQCGLRAARGARLQRPATFTGRVGWPPRSATCIPPSARPSARSRVPLHGGRQWKASIHMLQEIGLARQSPTPGIEEAPRAEKKKIMGHRPHRVYKVLDPARAPHLKAMAIKLSEELGDSKWDPDEGERIAQHHEGAAKGPQCQPSISIRATGLLLARHPDRFGHGRIFAHLAQ